MTPIEALKNAHDLLPAKMRKAQAYVVLLAIQHQEAPNREQRQIGGPAVGIWQFEKGGGIKGVLNHEASRDYARAVCEVLDVQPTVEGVAAALVTTNDTLDAAFARLLLWTDPQLLPCVGDVAGAWALYLRVWRPGAWTFGSKAKRAALRSKFGVNYAKAMDEILA